MGSDTVVGHTRSCGLGAPTQGGGDSLPEEAGVTEEGKTEKGMNENAKGAEKETWWECDYCSRAFVSLDVASAHELKCSRNPEVQQRLEAREAQVGGEGGESHVMFVAFRYMHTPLWLVCVNMCVCMCSAKKWNVF